MPKVRSISIVPSRINAEAGMVFRLEARLVGGDENEVIPEFYGYTPAWQVSRPGELIVREVVGHTVLLEAAGNGLIKVTAQLPGLDAVSADVTIIQAADAGAEDRFVTDHAAGDLLTLVLAQDGVAPAWNGEIIGIAQKGLLGGLQSGASPGGILAFSSSKEAGYDTVTWSNARRESVVFATAVPTYPPPVATERLIHRPRQAPAPITLRIWIDESADLDPWTSTTVEAIAAIHAADANQVFAASRLGATISATSPALIIQWDSIDEIRSDCGDNLASLRGKRSTDGAVEHFVPSTATDARVNVFYLNLADHHGVSCTHPATGDRRIFLNANLVLPTALAHELGHILSLDDIETIGAHNVMYTGVVDDRPVARRSHFTFGQLCIMNWGTWMKDRYSARSIVAPDCPDTTKDVR